MPDQLPFTSILRKCSNNKALADGRRIHAHLIKETFGRSTFLSNLLVQMYGKCLAFKDAFVVFDSMHEKNVFSWNLMIDACLQYGQLDQALSLFRTMPEPNVVSWNCMISSYSNLGHCREALGLFQSMRSEGPSPDIVTCVNCLSASSNLLNLCYGKFIHVLILHYGFESSLHVNNSLINMYGKCGCIENARKVFNTMFYRDVISWTAMVGTYARTGCSGEAIEFFHQMQLEKLNPNRVTIVTMLSACAKEAVLAEGRLMHALVVECQYLKDSIVGNALINMYSKCSSLEEAERAFDHMHARDLISWNGLIAAYVQCGCGAEAVQLFHAMQQKNIEPDKFTSNSLIAAFAQCGYVEEARKIFDEMTDHDGISWTAIITAYNQCGYSMEALELFQKMELEDIRPNKFIFMCVISAFGQEDTARAKQMHGCIINAGYVTDLDVANTLISMYSRSGTLKDARLIFYRLGLWNLVSWNSIITACVEHGETHEALSLFREMEFQGATPDKITFISIIDACAIQSDLFEGMNLHSKIVDKGLGSDVVIATALLDMYSKCGNLLEAQNMFETMPQKDDVTWNVMIAAYAHHGHAKKALQLFEQIQRKGVMPFLFTFVTILSACSHVGFVDKGCHYFIFMSFDYGIVPVVEHYNCIIDMLGRAGLVDEGEQLLHNMPLNPCSRSWTTLFVSCRKLVEVEELVHENGRYIEVLSNLTRDLANPLLC